MKITNRARAFVVVLALVACSPQQQQQSQATAQHDATTAGIALNNGALEVKVSAAIAAEAGINAFHITPKARDGVVTLTGRVPSMRIRTTVIDTVSRVPGVAHVIDQITVHGSI
jgi:osmotically-inducible protein OsmY